MIQPGSMRWLQAPLAMGPLALLCGLTAVTFPTIIRAAVSGGVTGCEFTPYLPFVLLSAFLLPWWLASAVALASVAVLGGLFVSPSKSSHGRVFHIRRGNIPRLVSNHDSHCNSHPTPVFNY